MVAKWPTHDWLSIRLNGQPPEEKNIIKKPWTVLMNSDDCTPAILIYLSEMYGELEVIVE